MKTDFNVVAERSSTCFRPLFIDGLELDAIYFYKSGKVLCASRSGWLDLLLDNDSKYGIDSTKIFLKHKPVRANKVNLDRADNFLVKGRRDYKFDKGFILYINVELEKIDVLLDSEKLTFDSPTENYYSNYYFINGLQVEYAKGYLDKNEQLQYKPCLIKSFFMRDTIYSRQEDKTSKKDTERLLERIKKVFPNASVYDVEKFKAEFSEIEDYKELIRGDD